MAPLGARCVWMPAFVRMQREGILDALDNQRRAAERSRSLIEDAALMGV